MTIKFIDLFAGMGGFRLGFEQAAKSKKIKVECVFSSEIKQHAIEVYQSNFNDKPYGDITKIDAINIPDFDVLLAGFPCQAFSTAGKRHGFMDTRGTLFFEIERILQAKKPKAFILENVDGLVKHDLVDKKNNIGRTLQTMLDHLEKLGYIVSWKVLNASDFGLAQNRKRIFIVGSLVDNISLDNFKPIRNKLSNILENNKKTDNSKLTKLLLSHFPIEKLYGKSIKDKRGGENNIHSWDIELKGSCTNDQKTLLSSLLKARRNKKWAELKGIKWMDGMPLTLDEISTFFSHPNLKEILDDLVEKKYLTFEHPKDIVIITDNSGKNREARLPRVDLPKGYNIVAGKMSYAISKILNPYDIAPTLVATDLDRVAVIDGKGLRTLTEIEQKRLFGYPDSFIMKIKPKDVHDLFGNTVAVPIVKAISDRVLDLISKKTHTTNSLQTNEDIQTQPLQTNLNI